MKTSNARSSSLHFDLRPPAVIALFVRFDVHHYSRLDSCHIPIQKFCSQDQSQQLLIHCFPSRMHPRVRISMHYFGSFPRGPECASREQVCTFVRRIHSSRFLDVDSFSPIPGARLTFACLACLPRFLSSSSSCLRSEPSPLYPCQFPRSSPFLYTLSMCTMYRPPAPIAESKVQGPAKSLFPLMCVFSIPKRAYCETEEDKKKVEKEESRRQEADRRQGRRECGRGRKENERETKVHRSKVVNFIFFLLQDRC